MKLGDKIHRHFYSRGFVHLSVPLHSVPVLGLVVFKEEEPT
jgi:hypothetical protein